MESSNYIGKYSFHNHSRMQIIIDIAALYQSNMKHINFITINKSLKCRKIIQLLEWLRSFQFVAPSPNL